MSPSQQNVLAILSMFSMVYSTVYYPSLINNEYNCDIAAGGAITSSDYCVIHCDNSNTNQEPYSVQCGSSGYCIFNCDTGTDTSSCFDSGTIYASNSRELSIISKGQQCMRRANVYSPNFGNVYISISSDTTSSESTFKEMTIYDGTNTESIYITCSGNYDKECKDITVNAQRTQFLKIIADDNAYLDSSSIKCPQNSNYNGPESAPCIIDVSGQYVSAEYLEIYTLNGSPQDVIFIGSTTGDYTGSKIYCSDNKVSVINGNTFDGQGDCWIPTTTTTTTTNVPSTAPSISPTTTTTITTNEPSIIPTITTTTTTTTTTTDVPSILPTVSPTTTTTTTIIPSAMPSVSPTATTTTITPAPSAITSTISPTATTSIVTTTASTVTPTTTSTVAATTNTITSTTSVPNVSVYPTTVIPTTSTLITTTNALTTTYEYTTTLFSIVSRILKPTDSLLVISTMDLEMNVGFEVQKHHKLNIGLFVAIFIALFVLIILLIWCIFIMKSNKANKLQKGESERNSIVSQDIAPKVNENNDNIAPKHGSVFIVRMGSKEHMIQASSMITDSVEANNSIKHMLGEGRISQLIINTPQIPEMDEMKEDISAEELLEIKRKYNKKKSTLSSEDYGYYQVNKKNLFRVDENKIDREDSEELYIDNKDKNDIVKLGRYDTPTFGPMESQSSDNSYTPQSGNPTKATRIRLPSAKTIPQWM